MLHIIVYTCMYIFVLRFVAASIISSHTSNTNVLFHCSSYSARVLLLTLWLCVCLVLSTRAYNANADLFRLYFYTWLQCCTRIFLFTNDPHTRDTCNFGSLRRRENTQETHIQPKFISNFTSVLHYMHTCTMYFAPSCLVLIHLGPDAQRIYIYTEQPIQCIH